MAELLDDSNICNDRLKIKGVLRAWWGVRKGQDPFEGLLSSPWTSPCRFSKEGAEGELTQPAEANDSMRETLRGVGWWWQFRLGEQGEACGWGLLLSWGASQVMMSAPWSVRERAFSRKLSLKDSIYSGKVWKKRSERRGRRKGRKKKYRQEKVGKGGGLLGVGWAGGQRDRRIRCLQDKKSKDDVWSGALDCRQHDDGYITNRETDSVQSQRRHDEQIHLTWGENEGVTSFIKQYDMF